MPDKNLANTGHDGCTPAIRETVCIHTRKIFDSCKDKDCIEDLRFYPASGGQELLNSAVSIRGGRARVLYVSSDVEPVAFNKGYYTVDLRYYYHVTLQISAGTHPTEVCGLCIFDKRVMLFGSEGNVKTFTSDGTFCGMAGEMPEKRNLPIAAVEAVDPLVLGTKLLESNAASACPPDLNCIPSCVADEFDSAFSAADAVKTAYVTLGQFSIVRLERETQLLMPAYSYSMPDKECRCGGSEDPCELFRSINFPVDEFFPPNSIDCTHDYDSVKCCSTR